MNSLALKEGPLSSYRDAVDLLLSCEASLREARLALEEASCSRYCGLEKDDADELKLEIVAVVESVRDRFKIDFERSCGVYGPTDISRKKFFAKNASRMDAAINRVIVEVKSRFRKKKNFVLELVSLLDEKLRLAELNYERCKKDYETAWELVKEVARQNKRVFMTHSSQLAEDPEKSCFYRGTTLDRFAVDPDSVGGEYLEILHFKPGIYSGVQCFTVEGNVAHVKSHAINPGNHGMYTLPGRSDCAVIIEIAVPRWQFPDLVRNGIVQGPEQIYEHEMQFQEDFLTRYGRFRIFDAYAL